MLERSAYAFYLALLVFSLGFAWVGGLHGFSTGDFTLFALATIGLALSRWLHLQGFAHWHFQQCADSLDARSSGALWPRSDEEAARATELSALFTRLEQEPEVWARGAIRREIATRLDARPALRAEFAESLARHPEL